MFCRPEERGGSAWRGLTCRAGADRAVRGPRYTGVGGTAVVKAAMTSGGSGEGGWGRAGVLVGGEGAQRRGLGVLPGRAAPRESGATPPPSAWLPARLPRSAAAEGGCGPPMHRHLRRALRGSSALEQGAGGIPE